MPMHWHVGFERRSETVGLTRGLARSDMYGSYEAAMGAIAASPAPEGMEALPRVWDGSTFYRYRNHTTGGYERRLAVWCYAERAEDCAPYVEEWPRWGTWRTG